MNTPPSPRPGMNISPEEAAGILRNWRDENRRLWFHTYHMPEEAIDYLCSGLGWIEELTALVIIPWHQVDTRTVVSRSCSASFFPILSVDVASKKRNMLCGRDSKHQHIETCCIYGWENGRVENSISKSQKLPLTR